MATKGVTMITAEKVGTGTLTVDENGYDVLIPDDDDEEAENAAPADSTGLQVDWIEQGDGTILIVFGGQARITLTEEVGDGGGVVYRSDALAKPQDELKEAIGMAVKNTASRTFQAEWKARNPTQPRKQTERTSKLDQQAQEIADLRAQTQTTNAMLAKLMERLG